MRNFLAAVAAIALAGPALAQSAAPTTPPTQPGSAQDPGTPHQPLPYDRGYDKPSPRTKAINTPNRDELNAANRAQQGDHTITTVIVDPAADAQYAADMAAYLDAMRAHGQAAAATDRRYERQQRAYADAMRAWRMQVADCNHGIQAACNAPPPDPAAFY